MTRDPVSLSPAENLPSKPPVRLRLLVAAHVILGLFFSIWSAVQGRLPFYLADLFVVPVFGIVLAQASLLGFWAVFSPAKWWMRLTGLLTGTAFLEALLYIGTPSEGFSLLVVLSTGGITAVFGLAHWLYADLRNFSQEAPAANEEGVRFSIRGLMLFTVVVAVTMVGARELRESGTQQTTLLIISVWSLPFVVIGLASVWAGLGLVRPLLRNVALLVVSAVLGAALTFGLGQDDWELYFYIISMMLGQAGVLIASLLVVRSCGYRLVRKCMPDVEPLD